MATKEEALAEYERIKRIMGKQPSKRIFFSHSSIKEPLLYKIFGNKAFSKLTEYAGDTPKVFGRPKSDLEQILIQYGELARSLNRMPILYEWNNAGLKPSADGIRSSHNLNWSDLANKFYEFAQGKHEWDDAIKLIPTKHDQYTPKETIKSCFVYVMFKKTKNLYKIGFSDDPRKRESTLQTAESGIKLIAQRECPNRRIAVIFEKILHEAYSHKRREGERFALETQDLSEIKHILT